MLWETISPAVPAPARPVGAEHAGHDLAVQHEIALAPVEARHRARPQSETRSRRPSPRSARRTSRSAGRAASPRGDVRRCASSGSVSPQPAGEALRIAPGLLFPPGLPFRVAAGLGLPRTPIRGLRPDPLAGERDLGPGRRRRAHPALDRLQHLFGHRAPEARDPRLRDRPVVADRTDRLGPGDRRPVALDSTSVMVSSPLVVGGPAAPGPRPSSASRRA